MQVQFIILLPLCQLVAEPHMSSSGRCGLGLGPKRENARKECQMIESHTECQIECQNRCQEQFQNIYILYIICQKECQNTCQKECQKERFKQLLLWWSHTGHPFTSTINHNIIDYYD